MFLSVTASTQCLQVIQAIIWIVLAATITVFVMYSKLLCVWASNAFIVIAFQHLVSTTIKISSVALGLESFQDLRMVLLEPLFLLLINPEFLHRIRLVAFGVARGTQSLGHMLERITFALYTL